MSEITKTEHTFKELENRYQGMTQCVTAQCRLATDLVGGQPASREGIEAFVKYQMAKRTSMTPEDMKEAVDRILAHEIGAGTRELPTPEGSELQELETKSVNIIRRDEHGPWLGDWMVKACIKNAASRIGLYSHKLGTKGDTAEMGQVRAWGVSLHEVKGRYNANRVYLRDGTNGAAAQTGMEYIKGKVSSPQGSKSIVTLAEVCPAGSVFEFQFRFFQGKIKDDDVLDIFSAAMVIGLGSARSFERGKFSITKLTVEKHKREEASPEKKKAKALQIPKVNGHDSATPPIA